MAPVRNCSPVPVTQRTPSQWFVNPRFHPEGGDEPSPPPCLPLSAALPLAVFDVTVTNEEVRAVIYPQPKDRQCIKIKAAQTETTYHDLHVIFNRSIRSSAQRSAHRLTQSPNRLQTPPLSYRSVHNTQPLSCPHNRLHTVTHTHLRVCWLLSRGPGCIDWFVLTDTENHHVHTLAC